MRLHADAALTPEQREWMVGRVVGDGLALSTPAAAGEVSDRTCSKWVRRYRSQGRAGLMDRSSGPHRVANHTNEQTVELLAALRRLRFTAPELAGLLDLPCSTISAILKRIGMGTLGRVGPQPAVRYERDRPGELIHIDVRKLGRIQGGAASARPVAADAIVATWTDAPACGATQPARVLTDNGAPYISTIHAIAPQPRRSPPAYPAVPPADQRFRYSSSAALVVGLARCALKRCG